MEDLQDILDHLRGEGKEFDVLFLDAEDGVLENVIKKPEEVIHWQEAIVSIKASKKKEEDWNS